MGVCILVLAAGASSRMRGTDKLLEPVEDVPLLRRQVRAALATGCEVRVCLPDAEGPRALVLAGLDCEIVVVRDAADGMSASIRAGIAGLEGAVMILPADMPEIDADDLVAVLDAFDGRVICRGAAAERQPGHPVVFPSRYLDDLCAVSGDQGAREVLRGAEVKLVPLPGRHALVDLDTPEDWAEWRGLRESRAN